MGGFFGAITKQDCVLDVFFGTDYHSIPYYIGVLLLFFYFCPKIKWNT